MDRNQIVERKFLFKSGSDAVCGAVNIFNITDDDYVENNFSVDFEITAGGNGLASLSCWVDASSDGDKSLADFVESLNIIRGVIDETIDNATSAYLDMKERDNAKSKDIHSEGKEVSGNRIDTRRAAIPNDTEYWLDK